MDDIRFAQLVDAWLMPDDDPEPVLYCDHCDEPVYEGEEVWEYHGCNGTYCSESCLIEAMVKDGVLTRWTAQKQLTRGWL